MDIEALGDISPFKPTTSSPISTNNSTSSQDGYSTVPPSFASLKRAKKISLKKAFARISAKIDGFDYVSEEETESME